MQEKKVKVEIFGGSYNVQGDAPVDYIEKLAEYVDNKMRAVAKAMPSKNETQVAILTALNIADEYFQLKNIDGNITLDIERKTNALISMLEEGIIGDVLSKEAVLKSSNVVEKNIN